MLQLLLSAEIETILSTVENTTFGEYHAFKLVSTVGNDEVDVQTTNLIPCQIITV